MTHEREIALYQRLRRPRARLLFLTALDVWALVTFGRAD